MGRTVVEGTFWRKIPLELVAEELVGAQKSVLLYLLTKDVEDVVEHC